MKILHLSDLHFKSQDISQDIVLGSLYKKISELSKTDKRPDLLVITGDIAFSGKAEEYVKARKFIMDIIDVCEIKQERVFLIPGNHDVDRSKIDKRHISWWYQFKNEEEVTGNLSSEHSFPIIYAKTEAYTEFAKQCMTQRLEIGKFGQYVFEVDCEELNNQFKLKIVGINSSLFCGYDGDDNGKLAIGMEQISYCDQVIDVAEDLVISCVHHPFPSYHLCEQPVLNTLQRFSDIILSGHVHEASNSARRDGFSGETIFVTAGSSFERRTVENGFNLIEFDFQQKKGNVFFYKYLPKNHSWIPNKDVNPYNDGVFAFDIPSKRNLNNTLVQPKIASTESARDIEKYIAVVDVHYDALNREKVNAIFNHLKTITGDLNITITKMERGSVKIFFETTKDLSDEQKEELRRSAGIEIIKIKGVDFSHEINSHKADKSVYHWKTFVKPEFFKDLQNPGATFTHSRVDNLELKDLYVSPNLKKINPGEEKDRFERFVNAKEILHKKLGQDLKIVIYGTDNSGKSTLLKWWYDQYYESGHIPILISGNSVKDISIDKLKKLVQSEFESQYNGKMEGNHEEFDLDRIIIMIDDFHKIRFTKPKFKANLISNLNKTYLNIFITASDVMQLETYSSNVASAKNIFEDFQRYQILEFGPSLRFELIKRWNGLGIEQLDRNELIRLNNDTEKHVESIIGKNFVPSYPIFLLTILQARELTVSKKPEYSVHGFYYELLINESLNKAVKNRADISLFFNYFTDYCYFLFNETIRLESLRIEDFIRFHDQYCHDYNIRISSNYIIETLLNSKLIKYTGEAITISYSYIYYFFVARYLANNIATQEVKDKIKLLCQRIHRDEFASIVMFLTHLSKNQFIIDQLLENSRTLFNEYSPVKLEEDVLFINDMIRKLPEQVYEPVDINKIKEEELREEDELDLQEREFRSEKDVLDYSLNEDISTLDILSKFIKAIKTIEIIGQVTKKYWGELKAPQKYNLAEETYMLGLRTLSSYYSFLEKDSNILVEYLVHVYRKRHTDRSLSKEDVNKASRDFLFSLSAMASFGIIRKVTNAIGFDKLSGTFADIVKNHQYNSVLLIDSSIKLDHNKQFPWDEIKYLKKRTEKHYLSATILKNLVINYLYIFYTTIEDRQRICELLDIKIEQQRLIDATSVIKKENPS